MKPIIIKNSIVPKLFSWFFPVTAITLFPFIFICPSEDEKYIIQHELIHFKQYAELFVIGFLIIYLYDFLKAYIRYRSVAEAYHSIRFEQEAYQNESNPRYLYERKPMAWKNYSVR